MSEIGIRCSIFSVVGIYVLVEIRTSNIGNNGDNAAAFETSYEFNHFVQNLEKALLELKIPKEKKELSMRLKKPFMEYGKEKMEIVFAAVLDGIASGQEIVGLVAYGLKVLRDDYEKLASK